MAGSRLKNSGLRRSSMSLRILARSLRATISGTRRGLRWSSLTRMRRRAAEIAARYPAVSPDELARASAIVAPQIQEVADWRANFPGGGEALRGFVASGFASIGLLFSIVCGLISVLAVPGGLVTRALRHAVVRRDGREIGRVRSAVRLLIAWSPVIAWMAYVGNPMFGDLRAMSPAAGVRSRRSRATIDGGWRRVDHRGSRPRTARLHRRHMGCAQVGNGQPSRNTRGYLAIGSGRIWNFTTLPLVPLPPSMCHTKCVP